LNKLLRYPEVSLVTAFQIVARLLNYRVLPTKLIKIDLKNLLYESKEKYGIAFLCDRFKRQNPVIELIRDINKEDQSVAKVMHTLPQIEKTDQCSVAKREMKRLRGKAILYWSRNRGGGGWVYWECFRIPPT